MRASRSNLLLLRAASRVLDREMVPVSEEHHPPGEDHTPVPGPFTEPDPVDGDVDEDDQDDRDEHEGVPDLPGAALALGVYRRNKLSPFPYPAATFVRG